MKKQLLQTFLVLLIIAWYPKTISAKIGADITYRCLGSGKYKIIAKIYRDCRASAFNNPTLQVFAGTSGGNGCGSYTLSTTRTGIRNITPLCSSATVPCTPANTFGTGEGVEEHTYETTVDFSTSPLKGFVGNSSCCEVTFAIGQCCRSGAITTGSANNDFWATCMINICNIAKTIRKCNSSPDYANAPIQFLCCNQAYYYNNGIVDTIDYDSITIKMASGIASLPNTAISYSSPFTARYPMTPYCIPPGKVDCLPNISTKPPRGFYLNESNGNINFTPTNCNEVGVVVVEATEYRRDSATGAFLVIGKTRRDVNLYVNDCDFNKTPTIEGPALNRVCEGDKICFNIDGKDETFTPNQTKPDTVKLSWNQTIPNATFSILNPKDREKKAEFCWQTKVGDAKDFPYHFTVTATDQHCPKPILSAKGFQVLVTPKPISIYKINAAACGKFSFVASAPAGFKGTPSFRWVLRDSLDKTDLLVSVKKADSFYYPKGGKFILSHSISNAFGCTTTYKDTLTLPMPPKVQLGRRDTQICILSTLFLKPTVINSVAPFKYYWTRPISHISGDTNRFLEIKGINRDTSIVVRVTAADGCRFYDTITVNALPIPSASLGLDQRICTYQTATFDAGHADTMRYLWSTGETTRSIQKQMEGSYWVTISDSNNFCNKSDTIHLWVNDTVYSKAGRDVSICSNDKTLLSASHLPVGLSAKYTWNNLTQGILLGGDSTYQIAPANPNGVGGPAALFSYSLLSVVTQNGLSCEATDTIMVTVNALPTATWNSKPLPDHCHADGDIELYPFISPKRIRGNRVWSGSLALRNNLIDSIAVDKFTFRTSKIDNNTLQNGISRTENVYLQYQDSLGCINRDSTTQRIFGNPVIQLQGKKYLSKDLKAPMSNSIVKPKPDTSINIRWTVLSAPLGVNPGSVLFEDPIGSQEYWMDFSDPADSGVYSFKYCVTSKSSGCESCDSTLIEITSNLTSLSGLTIDKNLKIWPNPIAGGFLTIGKTRSSGKYLLFTAEGKLVNSGIIIQGIPTRFNADELLPGIYHIMFDLESNPRISIKLVKF
jgi:hypothetical protein